MDIKPDNSNIRMHAEHVKLTGITEPKDFSEGGNEHRKAIIANTSLIVVLISAVELKPVLFGITVSVPILWLLICISHIYFFTMWRLTAQIESDSEKIFFNIRGLYKQALLNGTKTFPGKTKAQLFFIRALPIWAFIIGLCGVFYGLYEYFKI